MFQRFDFVDEIGDFNEFVLCQSNFYVISKIRVIVVTP